MGDDDSDKVCSSLAGELGSDGGGMNRVDLLVSIVTYSPDITELNLCLESLRLAVDAARRRGCLESVAVVLVDNGPGRGWAERLAGALLETFGKTGFVDSRVVSGHGNVGFGAGHNLAAAEVDCRYYLVLNPDVIVESDAVVNAIGFMRGNRGIGMLSPMAVDGSGRRQFLCKRYPAVFDLSLRGFAPEWMRRLFRERLRRYEMRDECGEDACGEIPIASGCFMFMRRDAWNDSGGFDPGFFMYFEDFDLSLRLGRVSRIAYVPAVRIVHFGGHTARKGWRHVAMFVRSAARFYRLHGLRLL